MKCTDKEWNHCRVEKMGCKGCHYNGIERNIEILENYVREWHDTDVAEAIKKLLEKYKMEKLKNSEIEELLENSISKDIIQEMITERKFLLQQNYEDFENDIELKTLIKILEAEE